MQNTLYIDCSERQSCAKKSLSRRLTLYKTVERLFHLRLPRLGSLFRAGLSVQRTRRAESNPSLRLRYPRCRRWLKNAGSNTLYKQVRVVRTCGMRRMVKRVKEEEKGERRAQFLLNKEVSRTKQLMSLRLGGPARGFVLITSRRESERGEVHEGEEKSRPLASFSSLALFLNPSLSVHLFFWLLFRSFIAAMGEKEDDCVSLKVGGKTEQ